MKKLLVFAVTLMFLFSCTNTQKPVDQDDDAQVEIDSVNPDQFVVNGVSFGMVEVEAGTFIMGSPESDDPDAWETIESWESPQHEVTITKNYFIGKTEVTQALWKAVMGTNPSYYEGDNYPVESVTWDDCQEFIQRLNELTGETFRLPTEAEWEFAARGGNKSHGYAFSGSDDIDEVAWYWQNSGDKMLEGTDNDWNLDLMDENNCYVHEVGTKQANELGIYDMSGNAAEWCSDRFAAYDSEPQTDPTGDETSETRAYRGGNWSGYISGCRVASRDYCGPDGSFTILGLRLAKD